MKHIILTLGCWSYFLTLGVTTLKAISLLVFRIALHSWVLSTNLSASKIASQCGKRMRKWHVATRLKDVFLLIQKISEFAESCLLNQVHMANCKIRRNCKKGGLEVGIITSGQFGPFSRSSCWIAKNQVPFYEIVSPPPPRKKGFAL